MTTKAGAFCSVADAIVPVPEDGICEWCGGVHVSRYEWVWDESQGRNIWQGVLLSDPISRSLIEKPENYSEDGL